jgi:hypothetical protein
MTNLFRALRGWNLLSLTALIGVGVIGAIQVKKLVLYPLTKEKVEFRKKWLQERLQEAAADDSYYANIDLNKFSVVPDSSTKKQ